MRRSFVRLTVQSVLLFWGALFLAAGWYAATRPWTHEDAQRTGALLAYEDLERTPSSKRASRLEVLRQHYSYPLKIVSTDNLRWRLGRHVTPGELIPERVTNQRAFLVGVFSDGSGGLIAGPINPLLSNSPRPMGLFLGLLGLPLLAILIAVRVERQLVKIERASEALAVGELHARVDNRNGPSNELATSFNIMAERVERLIQSRDELVQAVSHELGSPLSRLRFQLEFLEREAMTSVGRHRLESSMGELDRLEDLVAELLTYIQSDEIPLEPTRFAPAPVLTDLTELATLEADNDKELDVVLRLPNTAILTADPRQFQRALENILRNAVQHTEHTIRVTVQHIVYGNMGVVVDV
ncbi:MAG: histidine kinase dimerization/phospho-acceptor domain-containing protein, partial [Myxococcota bacterium]